MVIIFKVMLKALNELHTMFSGTDICSYLTVALIFIHYNRLNRLTVSSVNSVFIVSVDH